MMKQMAQEEAKAKGLDWPPKANGEQQPLFVEPKPQAGSGEAQGSEAAEAAEAEVEAEALGDGGVGGRARRWRAGASS